MEVVNIFLSIPFVAAVAIVIVNTRLKGILALTSVFVIAILSSYFAVQSLLGNDLNMVLTGTIPFGEVVVKVDALSAWFILTFNFTTVTSALYGLQYMKHYADQKAEITLSV